MVDAPAQEPMIFPDIVDIGLVMQKEEDQVQTCVDLQTFMVSLLVHEPKQKTDDAYYEILPILDAYKMTRLHHNLIMGGFGLWLYGLRSPLM